jgi:hypothetical protein
MSPWPLPGERSAALRLCFQPVTEALWGKGFALIFPFKAGTSFYTTVLKIFQEEFAFFPQSWYTVPDV